MSDPIQWEDVIRKVDDSPTEVFSLILSTILMENGGPITISVATLRELYKTGARMKVVAEIDQTQLVVSLVDTPQN